MGAMMEFIGRHTRQRSAVVVESRTLRLNGGCRGRESRAVAFAQRLESLVIVRELRERGANTARGPRDETTVKPRHQSNRFGEIAHCACHSPTTRATNARASSGSEVPSTNARVSCALARRRSSGWVALAEMGE